MSLCLDVHLWSFVEVLLCWNTKESWISTGISENLSKTFSHVQTCCHDICIIAFQLWNMCALKLFSDGWMGRFQHLFIDKNFVAALQTYAQYTKFPLTQFLCVSFLCDSSDNRRTPSRVWCSGRHRLIHRSGVAWNVRRGVQCWLFWQHWIQGPSVSVVGEQQKPLVFLHQKKWHICVGIIGERQETNVCYCTYSLVSAFHVFQVDWGLGTLSHADPSALGTLLCVQNWSSCVISMAAECP